jgi:hypothetical protein
VEPLPEVPELMVEPPELEPAPVEGVVELVLPDPDAEGELALELVPLPPELLAPPLIDEPVELDPEAPDVLGDAAGDELLSEIPAACIAILLQRSKSEAVEAPAMARPGTSSAATAADANTVFSVVMTVSSSLECAVGSSSFKCAASDPHRAVSRNCSG